MLAPDPALLAAIASPRRREILRLTWRTECGAGELREAMPDVSWGAVSQQLGALVAVGLLDVRVDGRRRFYRARPEPLGSFAEALERMWADALWKLKLAAELEASRRGPRSRVSFSQANKRKRRPASVSKRRKTSR